MNADPNAAIAKYPLRSLLPALRQFEPPTGYFNPAGPWEQTWSVCTLGGRQPAVRRVGRLTLRRGVESKTARLDVTYSKDLTGGRQEVVGTLEGPAESPLSTPVRWSFRFRLLDAEGQAIPATAIDPAGPYTVNWSLFDAVQRLPGADTPARTFTLIDHFDQVKPETTLSFRKAMDVRVAGGRTLRTRAYQQLGCGNVPWVYWTDEAGRLLWVVAGLEGYVLEPAPA